MIEFLIDQIFEANLLVASALALLTLVCAPITYRVGTQVLNGAVGAELIEVLSRTAKLQLLMAILLATALTI